MQSSNIKFAGEFHLTGQAAEKFVKIAAPTLHQQNLEAQRASEASINRWFIPNDSYRQGTAPSYTVVVRGPNDSEFEKSTKEELKDLPGFSYKRYKFYDLKRLFKPSTFFKVSLTIENRQQHVR